MTRTFTGKVPAEAIRLTELPRHPDETIEALRALVDLTATVSDAMDLLGLVGVVPGSTLVPIVPGARAVGPAITVRNVPRREQIHRAALEGVNTMGDSEAHNLARPGDVVVIEGVVGCSNFGGQSATMGRRAGEAGAIVDGSIRDPDEERSTGFPVWCRGVTPITGKWRIQTVEINGPVRIDGVQVQPGDLVCADDAGVCFVPFDQVEAVLEIARRIDAGDARRKQDIADGVSVAELMRRQYR